MPEEGICFLCRRPITASERSRPFERGGRTVILHEECLDLLGQVIGAAMERTHVAVAEEHQDIRSRILRLAQRDPDGLFAIGSPNVYNLAGREAVALVLYIEQRHLSISEIGARLKRCYKELVSKRISNYLTERDPGKSIRVYVSISNEGYALNSSGIEWFERNVAPRILEE